MLLQDDRSALKSIDNNSQPEKSEAPRREPKEKFVWVF